MKILDILTDETKWIKGRLLNGHGGYCLRGALSRASRGQHGLYEQKEEALLSAIKTLYPDGPGSITLFNDHPDTTFSDIQRVVKFADV